MVPLIRHIRLVLCASLVGSILVGVFMPAVSLAATRSAASEMEHQTERWMRMRGVYGCIYERGLPYNSSSQVMEGHFANGGATAIGYLNEDGKVSCDDGAFITNSNNKIGFEGNDYSYCAAQPSSYRTGGPDTASTSNVEGCVGGSGSFNNAEDHKKIASQWLAGLKEQVTDYKDFMTDSGGQYDESKYYMYYRSLVTFCGAKQGEKYGATAREKSVVSGDDKKVVINVVDGKGNIQPYVYSLEKKKTDKIDDIYQEMNADSKDLTCQYMAERTWALDTATASWVQAYNIKHPDAPKDDLSSVIGPDNQTDGTSCAVDGIGWIVCPVVNFLGSITDKAYEVLRQLLEVEAGKIFDTSGTTYQAWSMMRNIANVAFVIAFLFIIYSQITGFGVSNYGVKKLLPKIIISAVLVNVSFWVCALAVDISNILGSSLKNIMDPGTGLFEFTISDGDFSAEGNGWSALGVAILAGAGVVYLGLSILLPALIVVLFAVITVVAVLAMRQALIILLIVIAPLAFVAYLLPNTEEWFKKWFNLFKILLLMFPIISLIFGASALASTVVMGSSNSVVVQVMGALITAVPLFITPIVMKTAGGVLNRFGGIINNADKGPFDRMKKRAGEVRERQENRRSIRALGGGRVLGRGRYERRAKREAIDASLKRERTRADQQYVAGESTRPDGTATRFGKQLAGAGPLGMGADAGAIERALAGAQFTIDQATAEEIKASSVLVRGFDARGLKAIINSSESSDSRKAAAMQRLVTISDPGGPDGYAQTVNTALASGSDILRRSTAEALAKDGPGALKASDIDNFANGLHLNSDGTHKTLEQVVAANAAAGVLSQEKMVTQSTGDLKFTFDVSDANGKARLNETAIELLTNEQLKGSIKHNSDAITNIATGRSPTS